MSMGLPSARILRLSDHLLVTLYLVSGATGLAYEMLWTRMLALQFGVSIFGVIITTAAFMAGLGLGSLIGVRLRSGRLSPLRLFAVLEFAVAVLALLTPRILQSLDSGMAGFAAGLSLLQWQGLQMAMVFIILLLPALALGIGFPLVLRILRQHPAALSRLYGMNAIGAAVGALSPLLLLPWLGWLQAMQSVAIVGIGVALCAWLLARAMPVETSAEAEISAPRRWPRTDLIAYAVVGAAALMLEIGWSRVFGMIFLRTEYVLAVILAVYLLGIGIGSLLAPYLRHSLSLTVLPLLGGLFVMLGLWVLPAVSAFIEGREFSSLAGALLWQGLAVTLLTLPVTIVLGAWLPLLAARLPSFAHAGAMLYGVNALGAAFGALLAGFVLLPLVGSNATIVIAGVCLIIAALCWGRRAWLLAGVPVLALIGWPVWSMPEARALLPGAYAGAGDLFVHENAVSITQVVERPDGQRLLLADLRRMDASSDPDAVQTQKNQSRLPLLLHPAPHSVLYLGLGTGISAAGSLDYPDLQGYGVELSRGAIMAAGEFFAPVNDQIMQTLIVHHDDARHFLMSEQHSYDVIIGDLFHPDLVGRSALLSVQQFARARARLGEQGVFVQWLALNQFDPESLKIVLRSFQQVFPDGRLFLDAFHLALAGTREPWPGAAAVQANLARLAPEQIRAVTGGEGRWTWLGRYWGRLDEGPGPVQDEWAPRIEYALPQARYAGDLDLSRLLDLLLQRRPHVEQAAAELGITAADRAAFIRAYVATDLAQRSWLALLRQQDREGQRLLRLAYEANPEDRWIGFAIADAMLAALPSAQARGLSERQVLESVLAVRPDHSAALARLWALEQVAGNTAAAAEYRSRLQTISPLSRALQGVESP